MNGFRSSFDFHDFFISEQDEKLLFNEKNTILSDNNIKSSKHTNEINNSNNHNILLTNDNHINLNTIDTSKISSNSNSNLQDSLVINDTTIKIHKDNNNANNDNEAQGMANEIKHVITPNSNNNTNYDGDNNSNNDNNNNDASKPITTITNINTLKQFLNNIGIIEISPKMGSVSQCINNINKLSNRHFNHTTTISINSNSELIDESLQLYSSNSINNSSNNNNILIIDKDNSTIEASVIDYRWTLFDIPISHDSILSIIPPPSSMSTIAPIILPSTITSTTSLVSLLKEQLGIYYNIPFIKDMINNSTTLLSNNINDQQQQQSPSMNKSEINEDEPINNDLVVSNHSQLTINNHVNKDNVDNNDINNNDINNDIITTNNKVEIAISPLKKSNCNVKNEIEMNYKDTFIPVLNETVNCNKLFQHISDTNNHHLDNNSSISNNNDLLLLPTSNYHNTTYNNYTSSIKSIDYSSPSLGKEESVSGVLLGISKQAMLVSEEKLKHLQYLQDNIVKSRVNNNNNTTNKAESNHHISVSINPYQEATAGAASVKKSSVLDEYRKLFNHNTNNTTTANNMINTPAPITSLSSISSSLSLSSILTNNSSTIWYRVSSFHTSYDAEQAMNKFQQVILIADTTNNTNPSTTTKKEKSIKSFLQVLRIKHDPKTKIWYVECQDKQYKRILDRYANQSNNLSPDINNGFDNNSNHNSNNHHINTSYNNNTTTNNINRNSKNSKQQTSNKLNDNSFLTKYSVNRRKDLEINLAAIKSNLDRDMKHSNATMQSKHNKNKYQTYLNSNSNPISNNYNNNSSKNNNGNGMSLIQSILHHKDDADIDIDKYTHSHYISKRAAVQNLLNPSILVLPKLIEEKRKKKTNYKPI